MRLATEVGLFVGVMRGATLVLALAAIGLFSRMSPAIERILAENVMSVSAAQEMLSVLAEQKEVTEAGRARFAVALRRARAKVTVDGEQTALESVEAQWAALEGGDPGARSALVGALAALTAVNRTSMQDADNAASRLGAAGAWTVALLSLLVLAATQVFVTRLNERVVQPLLGMDEVVHAAESGDAHRRAPERGPPEVERIAEGLNRLLDLAASLRAATGTAIAARDRALIGHLLDAKDGAWVVANKDGEVLTANGRGRTELDGASHLIEEAGVEEEEVVAGAMRLVRLDAPPSEPEALD